MIILLTLRVFYSQYQMWFEQHCLNENETLFYFVSYIFPHFYLYI